MKEDYHELKHVNKILTNQVDKEKLKLNELESGYNKMITGLLESLEVIFKQSNTQQVNPNFLAENDNELIHFKGLIKRSNKVINKANENVLSLKVRIKIIFRLKVPYLKDMNTS